LSQPLAIELVPCTRQNMKITTRGCVKLFRSVADKMPEPWEARSACIACPVGAVRNGGPVNKAAAGVEAWRRCCSRCQAAGRRLIAGLVCVSCYNRSREAAIGRDRKGNRPRLADQIHTATINVIKDGAATPTRFDRVLSAAEALVATAKTATGPMVFGWPPAELAVA
jgi:hypothetical protein